jgi:anti-sigma regulatory factor (Ser/Thr protein kinase)
MTPVPYFEIVPDGPEDADGGVIAPLRLDPVGAAAAAARRYVADVLARLGREDLVDSARLGVSELVTNACLHAASPCVVRVIPTGETMRIEVSDDSPLVPVQSRREGTAGTGRGLLLVEAAGRWGVDDRDDGAAGKTVWFEPQSELTGAELSPTDEPD